MVYDGIQFPANLDTTHAVAQVLIQEPGKLRMKDLREGNYYSDIEYILVTILKHDFIVVITNYLKDAKIVRYMIPYFHINY